MDDRDLPDIRGLREEYRELVRDLVRSDPEHADQLLEKVVYPLIDKVALAQHWPSGRCRGCGTGHPGLWDTQHPTRKGNWPGHQMRCPRYLGPVHHVPINLSSQAAVNRMVTCSCGTSYPEYASDSNGPIAKNQCPDRNVSQRTERGRE